MKELLLKKIDNLQGFEAKLELLNNAYLDAKSFKDERIILKLIDGLKNFGQ
tara:strand:+ start:1928 stop:2080 length:153 start_codon:yes stop_codon:yes gene_type:complete